MKLDHALGFDESSSLPGLNRQATNCYPKHFNREVGGQPVLDKQLHGTPGAHQLATTGTDPNRGSTTTASVGYFVNGQSLFRLNSDFTTSNLGTVVGSGQVSMSDNGAQVLIIVPGNTGYIYDVRTQVFGEITDPDFFVNGIPQHGDFIDSRFMVSTDTKKWIISDINDGTSWNPLFFGSAEANPDPIVAPLNFNNEAYITGTETIQNFSKIGGTDFPYEATGLVISKGVFAPLSLELASNTFMWIGGGKDDDPSIWQLVGTQPVKVSNTGVDLKLIALSQTELSQVTSFSYAKDGSFFVGWNLPNEAIVYEQTSNTWHLRRSEVADVAGNVQTVGWRAINLITVYDKLVCFDRVDGRVGELSNDFFDEYGADILREFDVEPQRTDGVMMVPRIKATVEAGVGDTSTPNPLIRMKLSRDGKAFGGERQRKMGSTGETLTKPIWRRNGWFRDYFQARFLFSEQVKFVVIRVDAVEGLGAVT